MFDVPPPAGRGGKKARDAPRARFLDAAPRAVCPLYPKIKQEGWWVVLGDRETDELLALRRVSFGSEARTRLTYETRARAGVVVAFLVSDCYVGLDQETELAAPRAVRSASPTTTRGRPEEDEPFWLAATDSPPDVDDAFFWEREVAAT